MKNNVLSKSIFILLLSMLIFFSATIISNAATSISISTSKSSVSPGGTFTVTVSAVGAGPVTTSVSNGTGGKTEFLDNSSYSFTCTAGSSGSVTISASGLLGDYETGDEANRSASKTVKIVQPSAPSGGSSSGGGSTTTQKPTITTKPVEKPKSSNNKLSALSVVEGEIIPAFEKDIREYALTIPYEISEANITATPSDSKANVVIEGNKDLKEGENIVTIKVTAEDGTVANYSIKVTRKRVPIALKSLVIKYENQEGQILELPLNPTFNFNILEYTLQDLEYFVQKLSIEAVANLEGATIDIQGADVLQTGENTITITARIPAENTTEGEEIQEETISYIIKVNRLEEPTLFAKIKDWFKGIMGTVGNWFNNNKTKIILGSLILCIVALVGLSVYIVIDYRKYKDLVAKLKKLNEINGNASVAHEIEQTSNNAEEIQENREDRPKGGKHF